MTRGMNTYVSRRFKSTHISKGYVFKFPNKIRFINHNEYAHPRITPVVANTAVVVLA